MQIFIFLAEGFEEIEAISVVDILRRSGSQVTIVSITNQTTVSGAHDISIVANNLFEETDFSTGKAFVLPGGMPGSIHLSTHKGLTNLLKKVHLENKIIAAICAAPLILGELHLLHGRNATIYPGFENRLIGANYIANKVVKDGNIITGEGPASSFDFALSIVAELKGKEKSKEIAETILWK